MLKTRIKEPYNMTNKCLTLENGMELCIFYGHISGVSTWESSSEIEIIDVTNDTSLFYPYWLKNLENGTGARARIAQNSNLIPQHKFDMETVERIKNAESSQIQPILPDLFEWIGDPNWPIAQKLAVELVRFGDMILPYLNYYLRNPDGQDEYSIHYFIMPLLNRTQLEALRIELERISTNPSDFEKSEEYDLFALKYLEKINDTD